MCFLKRIGDDCDNGKNAHKKLLSLIGDNLVNNIIWPGLFGHVNRIYFLVAYPKHIITLSFSCQRAECCLIDLTIPVLVAHLLYQMPMVLKSQQFEDNGSNEIKLRGSKSQ